jgi:hypothetical protein
MRTQLMANLVHRILKNSGASFTPIAKKSEGEESSQRGSSDFVPADTLQIPRGDSQQVTPCAQMIKQLGYGRANIWLQLRAICVHLATHHFECSRQRGFKDAVANACP